MKMKRNKKKHKKRAENESEILVWLQDLGLWRVEVQAFTCPVGSLVVTAAWL